LDDSGFIPVVLLVSSRAGLNDERMGLATKKELQLLAIFIFTTMEPMKQETVGTGVLL
jgi:hypothetical protein